MARGSEAKEYVSKKMLETFEGSFMQDDKILRVPVLENGATVEIKVTLTAAKDILGAGAAKTDPKTQGEFDWSADASTSVEAAAAAQPTDEEKQNIRRMMAALGL
jgi:hypothetical protein